MLLVVIFTWSTSTIAAAARPFACNNWMLIQICWFNWTIYNNHNNNNAYQSKTMTESRTSNNCWSSNKNISLSCQSKTESKFVICWREKTVLSLVFYFQRYDWRLKLNRSLVSPKCRVSLRLLLFCFFLRKCLSIKQNKTKLKLPSDINKSRWSATTSARTVAPKFSNKF